MPIFRTSAPFLCEENGAPAQNMNIFRQTGDRAKRSKSPTEIDEKLDKN